MHEKRGEEHFGGELRESAQVQAERLVRQELKKVGWQEKELGLRRKGDVAKLRIAKLHTTRCRENAGTSIMLKCK
jgi:hypothetical protein